MRAIRTIGFLVVVVGAFMGGYIYRAIHSSAASSRVKAERKVLYWVDPMHPAYKSDKPGIAPDCGMKLEPVYADGGGSPRATQAERKVLYYRDPKDPNYRSPRPGLNPVTGSNLEPIYEEDLVDMPAGTVQIGPDKQQLIGVKYGQAEVGTVSRTIRAAGKVVFDETRIEHVHTKVEGWVDKVFVNFTGKLVEKGQPLVTIYSPEMLASQQEFLLAAKAQDMMRDNTFEAALDQSKSLLNASRRRLQLWDLSDAQIDRILKTGEPIQNFTLYSPVTGYVMDRKAFPQIKVTPDTDLYTVVDLNRVWILADVFEYEAPSIQVGDAARVSLSYLPGKTLMARIDYIQPQVDPMTRTLKVRLNMENPGMFLKPDMYVDVEFRINLPA